MKNIVLTLGTELHGQPQDVVLKAIDREVDAFSQFMATLPDWKFAGPLHEQERVLLKSYLVQKLNGKLDGAS